VVIVHNFTYGLLNPLLGYAMSCIGSFLGLRCVVLSRAYQGWAKARWLILAAVSIGAVGIWAMHFIAMLGFTITGEQILYNVPVTVGSMLLSVVVVGLGLAIVGYANPNSGMGAWPRLLIGGAVFGVGVAAMHYMGMAGMIMPGSMSMSYSVPVVLLSVLIAIVAGTTALWIGTWVRSMWATVIASLVMGVAVTGMHYTGMAALRILGTMSSAGSAAVSGATATSFVIPVLVVLGLAAFLLTLAISVSPSEDEIRADAELRSRLEVLQKRDALQPVVSAEHPVEQRGRSDHDHDGGDEAGVVAEAGIGHVHAVEPGDERRHRDDRRPARHLLADDVHPVALDRQVRLQDRGDQVAQ
jgi:NO-binding membrane sensor protein with MHYT domain